MKKSLFTILTFFMLFAHTLYAESNKAEVNIKFFDRTMYYPGETQDNPVQVQITVSNTGTDTYRFKLANNRMFSVDFFAYNVKNTQLARTEKLIRTRTTNQTVYYREITLEPGEQYSFVENLKEYLNVKEASIYYIELNFYPDLIKNENQVLISNRLSLEVRPSPAVSSSNILPVEVETASLLQAEAISPDKVVEQTVVARQRSLWDQFFLYMDVEEMLKRDPSRSRKYNMASADERNEMLRSFRADLMQQRIDRDIVAIPSKFEIETTTYSQTEGTVSVIEYFDNGTFTELKRYTYYVRQRDGIWQIYDYTVDNLGTM